MKSFIKPLALLIIFAACTQYAISQNSAGQSDDFKRIAISPTLPPELSKYPQASLNVLLNKMKNIVSLNGMSALEGSNIFIIYPQISVIKSDVTATSPAMYALRLEVILNVADFYTGNIYASASHEVAGVGRTEQVAYNAAFQQIPDRAGKYKVMMEKAKNEIVGYYNSHCDLAISRAKSLAAQRRWSDALDLLNSVPPVSRECFDKANLAAEEIARNMPYIIPAEHPIDDEKVKAKEIETSDLVELGNNVFIRYKSARLIGDKTTVYFELISRNEDDYDQIFWRIYETFIINEKGEELRINLMTVGKKESNHYIKATLIPEVNTELVCEFPKVKEVKMLRFMINDNLFRFKNIVLAN
ncbi:MAG: hypothetical protein Q7J05_02945 [Paludibacter sp.]|nr:hypothetical protein [Paludibacter sp.]